MRQWFIAALCLGMSSALMPANANGSGCALLLPGNWRGASVHWLGACISGRASGPGAAVRYEDGKPPETFFGEVSGGRMVRGVFSGASGYRAGGFRDGNPVAADDRNTVLADFRAASGAARSVSARMDAEGNRASARYYAEMAERLEGQMD